MAAVHAQGRMDENSRGEGKGAAGKGGGGNGRMGGQGNQRRALGDIGNLVGALSTRCSVNKDGSVDEAKPVARVMHPMVRRSAAGCGGGESQANAVAVAGKVTDAGSWGAKQRRTTGGVKLREVGGNAMLPPLPVSTAVTSKGRASASCNAAPCRAASSVAGQAVQVKESSTGGGRAKKDQTLTAILTARSEAACGGFDAEMVEAEVPLRNIDEADIGNHLAVVDYVEDIYSFYRKAEVLYCVSPDYMQRQADINEKMRAILVDWLIEVHLKFKLMPETLFLTTNLIDRYLSAQNVSRKNLQLVGMTAMLLAAKYEEIFAPVVKDFVFISDHAYSREQVLSMEKNMLNTLHFNLTVPTPYVFIVRFLKAASSSDKQLELVSFFLVELCLVEYSMVKFPPSQLAAAAVYTAHYTLKRSPCWTTLLQRHSGYQEQQLKHCATMMVNFHKKAGEGNLTVVHKKYSSTRHNSVAGLSPASLPGAAEEA